MESDVGIIGLLFVPWLIFFGPFVVLQGATLLVYGLMRGVAHALDN